MLANQQSSHTVVLIFFFYPWMQMVRLACDRAKSISRKPPRFIMRSTCPRWTWNTQVLWSLHPPWQELSISLFQSNFLARLCHLYFHNCLVSWFWREKQSVLPRLTSSPVFRSKRKYPETVKKKKKFTSATCEIFTHIPSCPFVVPQTPLNLLKWVEEAAWKLILCIVNTDEYVFCFFPQVQAENRSPGKYSN